MSTKTNTETLAKDRLHKRLRTQARHRYYQVMPNKKRHRVVVWVVFFVIAAIIAVQLLYPPDRALPLAQIDGERVGWQQENDIATRAEEQFQATKLNISIEGGGVHSYRLGLAGAQIETDQVAKAATQYPFWQRYIPLSILMPRNYDSKDSITFSDSVIEDFSKVVAKDLSYEPQDARLQIKDGALEAHSEKAGRTVDNKALISQVKTLAIADGGVTAIVASSQLVHPKTTAQSLQSVRTQAERALSIPLTFTVGKNNFVPDKTDRAAWLLLGETEQGEVELRMDNAKFGEYLSIIDKEVGTPAGQTHIILVDGNETARQQGDEGKTVDVEAISPAVSTLLLNGTGSHWIELPFRSVSPQVIYNETYTASEAGLRAYANDTARRYNSAIAVWQVDNGGWSAEARADVSLPSASTYKLYIAKLLFDRMNRGEIQWGDRMMDTTVSGCFDRMVIASTNACSEEWIGQFGRTNINNELYSMGFSQGTTFTNPTAAHTTANDLRRFMVGVNKGSLVQGAQRDRLLSALSSHSFRQGVPAGSKGRVFNKVGFLWDYTHDAAIVQHPRGTYVIVVMTKGQSYARIASITREVERIMYP